MSGTPFDCDSVWLGEFTFECGQTVPDLEIAYESYGEFDGDNAVLVCHALTGSQNVARTPAEETGQAGQARAWWDDIVGPGKAIDTTEHYVVCANVPGSCYGSSGPSSVRPASVPGGDGDTESDGDTEHDRWGTDFPPVQVEDWTRAQRRLLDELGVGRLHAVVGGSVGGMNALEWAKRYPDDARYVIPVATAARLDPQCLALEGIARRAIRMDADWNGGDYYGEDRPDPDDGLALARQIGHVMYLSKSSMVRKFGRRSAGRNSMARGENGLGIADDPAVTFFPYRDVESYLDYNAAGFVDRFDANSYLYLTRAMDEYDLSAGYTHDADALAAFEGEALVLSFTGDWHFTVGQSAELADAFRECDVPVAHHVVDSEHGHDAFLVEPEAVGPPIGDFLADGTDGRAVVDADEDVVAEAIDENPHAPVHAGLFSGTQ